MGKDEKETLTVRINIHLGDVDPDSAQGIAQNCANDIGGVVWLVAEPAYNPGNPKGKRFSWGS